MPNKAIKLLITPILSNFLLYKINPINGTITTFTAVIKAFFATVVYTNPKVCVENPINEHKPKTAPAIKDSFDIFSFICL